jgi:alanine-synthesizing transaminase
MFAKRTNWNLAENRLSRALAARRGAGESVIDLSASNPTACGFALDEKSILQAFTDRAALQYTPDPHGLPAAREAVAQYYESVGANVSPDDIFLTTGTSEAYSFLFRMLCDPGDEILVPAPGYPLFDFLADLQDVRLVRYYLLYDHGWQIDFQSIERALGPRARAIIVVHPNNPTGHYVKTQEAAQLAEICARHDLAMLADEVFYDFSFEPKNRPPSFAAQSQTPTFALSGLSKISGLPQMKAGWIAASGPQPLKSEALTRLEVIADTYLSMNAPVQCALPVLLEQRHAFQSQLMARVRQNLKELDAQLVAHPQCNRLQIEGGWNAVLRVPAVRSDEETAIDLIQSQGVYLHPGHFYDFPSDGYMVVSLLPDPAQFSEGISRVLSFF